jgi:hypothetical protein
VLSAALSTPVRAFYERRTNQLEVLMLFILALPVFASVALIHRYLARFAPTNVLVRHVHAREVRWQTSAGLAVLATGLLAAMHALVESIERGAPGWLNLVVLGLAWDAIKIAGLSLLVASRASRGTVARVLLVARRSRISGSSCFPVAASSGTSWKGAPQTARGGVK